MTVDRVVVEADGGARGNPGPAGYGAAVVDPDTDVVLAERSAAIGVATNNVAEYSGLIAGLAAAAELGAREVAVRMDSKLVVEQMAGRWKIKHPGLRPLATEAAALARRFDRVSYQWVPRARNARADALANAAMDAAARGGTAPPRRGATAAATEAAEDEQPPPPAELSEVAEPSEVAAAGAVPQWAPRTGTPTRLLLVRHAQTAYTASRRYSGRGDVPLSPAGQTQAAAVARRVAALVPEPAAVVSSPLSRATATADAIAARYGIPVTVDSDFIECDFGVFEGLTFAEVSERFPVELAAWLADTAVAPPQGESFDAVAARTVAAGARLRQAHPGRTVIVVSHVSPIKMILRDALAAGAPLLYRLYLDPASVSTVDYWPDGGVAVRGVNDTAHL